MKKGKEKAKKISLPSVGIPTYEGKPRDSLFVQVNVGDKFFSIRKRTAVWLFNDRERVSSDRIFRVRAKQPNESENLQQISSSYDATLQDTPIISDHVVVGDFFCM